MTETAEAIKIQRGLKGVYFDRSPCTFIDGKAGELRYRGYSIHDLAEHSSFEETAWLLLNGELPNKQQLAGFDADLKAARKLPAPVLDIIRAIKSAHPMNTMISFSNDWTVFFTRPISGTIVALTTIVVLLPFVQRLFRSRVMTAQTRAR